MSHHGKGADQLMVGTDLVKLVRLKEALRESAGSGLSGREAVVDSLLAALSGENYIPPSRLGLYRTALWREHLRSRGEEFSAFYSELQVTLRSRPGQEAEATRDLLHSILAEFELKAVITVADPEDDPAPAIVIEGQVVAQGVMDRAALKAAVSRTISGW